MMNFVDLDQDGSNDLILISDDLSVNIYKNVHHITISGSDLCGLAGGENRLEKPFPTLGIVGSPSKVFLKSFNRFRMGILST